MEMSPLLTQQIRFLRIVLFTLVLFVLSFAAFVLFRSHSREGSESFTTWVFAFFGVLSVFAAMVVPRLAERSAMRRILAGTWKPPAPIGPVPSTDEEKLAVVFRQTTLVRAAILDGAAIMNLMECMLTGHVVNWAVFGLLLVLLLMCFPSYQSVSNWIDAKLVRLKEERQLSATR
ncbi:MAG: hypothetical protein AB7F89_05530 [Pirellulaceae bacterium]